jgi:hypothetical protein
MILRMVERSSRRPRGGPVDWAIMIATICALFWLTVFVADETHERAIGFGLAVVIAIGGPLQWRRRNRRSQEQIRSTAIPTGADASGWESDQVPGVSTPPQGWSQPPDWNPVDRRQGPEQRPAEA